MKKGILQDFLRFFEIIGVFQIGGGFQILLERGILFGGGGGQKKPRPKAEALRRSLKKAHIAGRTFYSNLNSKPYSTQISKLSSCISVSSQAYSGMSNEKAAHHSNEYFNGPDICYNNQ